MAKDRINHAIQRGQGKSSSGAMLEPLLIEAMSSGNVAIVIDCLTDNKLRALQDIKLILSKYGAQVTPTNYLFAKKGVVRIKPGSGSHSFDNVLEIALEAEGIEDVQEGEGKDGKPEIHVLTEPSKTGVVTWTLRDMIADLEVLGHSIEWVPNEDTIAEVPESEADDLGMLIEKLEDHSDVNEVYTNAKP
jgi:transcriptional/translational regulatory protein YebC/TACO1